MGTLTSPTILYLRHHVTALKKLLDDPHPGLSSWAFAYHDHLQAIVDFWENGIGASARAVAEDLDAEHDM